MTVYAIIIRVGDKQAFLGSITNVENAKFITNMLEQLRKEEFLKVDEVICKEILRK